MPLSTWREGQLVDKLEETHALFGLPPKEAPSPARQPAASQHLPPAVIQRSQSRAQNTAENDEAVPDLNSQPPPPRTVEYLEPSFSLERPVRRFKMDERLEVHNNFISAISNKMHQLDLIHRLKKSEPHNAVHYQTDDYFRQTKDLPLINPLTTHEEIAKFLELFDVHEAVSRVTTEVDILERHMRRPGMYPASQSPIPTTSGFVPNRPSSAFKPIHLTAPSTASRQATQGSPMVDSTQETGSSPGSSIPCAQTLPVKSTFTSIYVHSV